MSEHEAIYWWLTALAYAALASVGGVLGHLMHKIDRKEPIHLGVAALKGVAAGFTGFLILLACNALKLDEEWKGVIVGLCGWIGADATIRILEAIVRKRLGLDPNQPSQVQPNDSDTH